VYLHTALIPKMASDQIWFLHGRPVTAIFNASCWVRELYPGTAISKNSAGPLLDGENTTIPKGK
jgi:hypothetical protein